MKKKLLAVIMAVVLTGSMLAGCSSSGDSGSTTTEKSESSKSSDTRTVTDSDGKEVTIPKNVTKVAPTIGAFAQVTEMLTNGNGKIAAAVTQQISDDFKSVFKDYEKSNPKNYDSSSVEDLIAAGVQVAYGPSSMFTDEQLKQLEEAGIVYVNINSIEDSEGIMKCFQIIGNILGEEESERAEKFVQYYKKNIQDAQKRTESVKDEDKVKVIRLGAEGSNYTTVNKTDIFNSIVKEAGGINVAENYEAKGDGGGQSGLTVDTEQIVSWNPDVIITLDQNTADKIKSDPALASVKAVKEGKVYNSPTGLYLWGVRSGENAMMPQWLGQKLYPDLFSDLDMEDVVIKFYKDWYNTDIDSKKAASILAGQ